MMWFWIVCILFFYLIHLYTKWSNFWKSRGVPHEKPFLIFGNLYNVVTRKEHLFERVRSIYNRFSTPLVGIFLFYKPAILVRSPELLKKILIKDFDKFTNRTLPIDPSADHLAVYAIFFARNEMWRSIRAKFSPAFSSSKAKSMFNLMQKRTEEFCDFLGKYNGEVVEVKDLIKRFSADLTTACVLGGGTDCYTNENSELFKMMNSLIDPRRFIRGFSMFCHFFLSSAANLFKLTFADKEASDYLGKVFNATRAKRQGKNPRINDFIDSVLNFENENLKSDNCGGLDVVPQVLTYFGAGLDTISVLLTFAIYELAINEPLQNRLRKEIAKSWKECTYESIQNIKYLDMVIKETVRKYPLAGILIRVAEDDYLIEETGFTIKKGTPVIVPVSGLHYDPEFYPDPYKFDPERFSEENVGRVPSITYLPFGEGPRHCIGQRVAVALFKVALGNLVARFRFETVEKTVKTMEFDCEYSTLVQIKGDLYLRILAVS